MDELTMLRQQMDAMKQSLDRSNIINKQLMGRVMRQRSSWLKNTVMVEAIINPIFALLFWGVSVVNGVSSWFAVAFLVLSAIDTACDYKTLMIPTRWFSELDVITLRKRLLRQKTLRKKQYIVSLPLAVAWVLWFGYAFLSKTLGVSIPLMPIVIILALAVIAGVWLSLVVYRRAQRTNDDLLHQLTEYEE